MTRDPADEPLTPRQVAETLGVTVRTVQRWITEGRLPATRVGGRMRVSRSSLSRVQAGGAPDTHAGATRSLRAVLIANRGEIAVRVARTVRRLGMRSIGIHAADDRPPRDMDLVLAVPDYLDMAAILDAARRGGADAIHPGYGFLSENPAFADAVVAAGLAWIGPPAAAIRAMGDKAAARRAAAALGVPVLPGYDGDDQADARLVHEAGQVGFPLLVKPSAGGGGKGMRIVRAPGDLEEALGAARREAARAFGDERLILERLLDGPRHVEVQLLIDAAGQGVHLGERDCSAQRRNQKIVEEAPGPAVAEPLRQAMGAAALAVAGAAGYVGAGTVEFLVDDAGGFHFLEMNARLQVEHPVTEAVTGRDLVADQLRIAAGQPLGLQQGDVALRGHAFEARLYAEDPEAGFLPASGSIVDLRWPDGVRVDTGLVAGDRVTDRYDPMLAKIIVHAADRAAALARLAEALAATRLLGVRTNLRFLRWLVQQQPMRDGQVRTDTIDHLTLPEPVVADDGAWRAAAAAVAHLQPAGAWAGGWRLNGAPLIRLRHEEEEQAVRIEGEVDRVAVADDDGRVHVDVEGQSLEFVPAPAPSVEEAVRHAAGQQGGIAVLSAPMPGRVVAIRAAAGASVQAHQTVIVLEAMKMEHAVVAPMAGIIRRVEVVEGEQVARGQLLAEVDAEGEAPASA